MAKKSCALIGPGKGPLVHVGTHGKAVVNGIKADEYVLLVCKLNDSEDICYPIASDGEYEFVACTYAQVEYQGKNRRFICCIMIGG